MLFDGWDSGGVVGELDLDAAAFGDEMLGGELDQYFDIFLTDVEVVLVTHHTKTKSSDCSSEFEPSVVGSDGVGDGLGPSALHEGIHQEGSIDS
jgi:hypothetical protein